MSGDRAQLGGVRIAAPDARWAGLFDAERRRLTVLGVFLELEHFGSTAVPGLAAKPVIDILACAPRLADLDAVEPALAALGYRRLDVGFQRRRFYRNDDVGGGAAANLHVVTADRWADKSERLFRDWLIAHPGAAREYADLKDSLARRHAEDMEAYTAAKTAFIQGIVNQARAAQGWPPQTDWSE